MRKLLLVLAAVGFVVMFYAGLRKSAAQRPSAQEHSLAMPGQVVTARGTWPCAPSIFVLNELGKWSARGDQEEFNRVVGSTQTAIWRPGMEAKILDVTGLRNRYARIRIMVPDTIDSGLLYGSVNPMTLLVEYECWVPAEAVQ